MYQHHLETINNLVAELKKEPSIHALLLGGSIAHGFAEEKSDIDISIIIDQKEYCRRNKNKRLTYWNSEMCTYEGGYIDGKYITVEILDMIAEKGSEPARFAFMHNKILFSRIANLEEILADITCYPEQNLQSRINRFAAQLFAWVWYFSEGRKKGNRYLEYLAVQKFVLFSARIILALNRQLYPYHKWLLRVLESCPAKPADLLNDINSIIESPDQDKINSLCSKVLDFAGIDEQTAKKTWPDYFISDSELNWINHEAPVDDI